MAEIALHGWTTLVIPSRVLFEVSSRAFAMYCYLVFRDRKKEGAYPGIPRIADDLSASGESWSQRTVKRALAELSEKRYIYRERRLGKSTITHVYSDPDLNDWATDVPPVRPQVAPLPGHPRPDRSSTQEKEYEEEDSAPDGAQAPTNKTKAELDELFEVIAAESFGITDMALVARMGGRIGKLRKYLTDNWPEHGADDLRGFYRWYGVEVEASPPKDAGKFADHYTAFVQSRRSGDGGLTSRDENGERWVWF